MKRRQFLQAVASASVAGYAGTSQGNAETATTDGADTYGVLVPSQEAADRAPVVLENGDERHFTYSELDIGPYSDWTEKEDREPVWDEESSVHYVDTTVEQPDTEDPHLHMDIYQEIAFSPDCDSTAIVHPQLSEDEWEWVDQVSNADTKNWLMLHSTDEVKAALDEAVWRLADPRAYDQGELQKYGLSEADCDVFDGDKQPGTSSVRLVGIDPQQPVHASEDPRPTYDNGHVELDVPKLPDKNWYQKHRRHMMAENAEESDLTGKEYTEEDTRPSTHIDDWEQVLTSADVTLGERTDPDRLAFKEECGG